MDLFKEVIPSILQTKGYLIHSEFEEKQYVPYTVNKALSQHIDCILHASEMNLNPHLDKKLQYDYLYHAVRKYKRPFQKWLKPSSLTEDVLLVKEYYGCNKVVAEQYCKILTKEQIKFIKGSLDKGGKSK